MNQRNDQIVYLNNCELVIQSLAFRVPGTYYIVWKKGKKNTQSNKFTITNDRVLTPKETLSLSLKVYYHGTTPQPRHTQLILFNNSGEQIERTKLMIHEWTADYNERTINIGGGTIKIKGKRRGVMKLEKFHRLRSEVEETSDDQSNRFLKKASNKQSNTEKDELLRLTKQVEDLNFLVDKLKQQRNAALVRIQKLELELSQVNDKMSKDLAKLREYFARKTEMRESIYKQQIQQLVTSFNRNYELNFSMMQNLIQQKFDYEQEIRELKQSNQQYIASQSRNFENLIADMQKHKQAVDDELKDSNEKIGERQARINQLNDEIDHLNEQLEQMRNNYKKLQDEKQEEQEKTTGIISQLNIKVTQNQALIHQQTLMIERLTSENKLKEDQNLTLSNLVADHAKDKNQLHLENMKLIDAREELIHSNQILTMKNQQLDSELAQLHNTLTKMREEFDQLTKKNAVDLQEKYIAYTKDIEEERTQNLQLNTKLEQTFHQREMLSIRIAELEGTIVQKDDEIEIFRKELEHSKLLTQQLTKEMAENVQKFKEHQAELSDRLSQYIQRSNQLQSENTQLHSQIRQLHLSTQQQLMKMKEEYDILAQSNKRLLEDQIDMLKKQKEEDDQATNTMRTQYEHELTTLMESHRTEIEELEKVYREDCDRKEGEVYLLLQDKNRLQEEFEAFKFKVQMDESNREQEMALLKIKKGYPDSRMQKIEEENIEEIESQEQEEEQIVPVKKQKLKKKPIRIEVPSEEEEVESQKYLEESQEEQGEDDYSVFEILKERKKKKDSPKHGKLKVKKQAAKRETLELSKDLEEDQQQQKKKQPQIAEIQVQQSSQQMTPKPKMIKKPTSKAQKNERSSKIIKGTDTNQLLQQKAQLQQQKNQLQQRIVQLQQENQSLKLSDKNLKAKFQREQKKYTNKIKLLEQQIASQNAEIEQLFLKINQQDSKFAESYRKEAEKKKKEAEKEEKQRKAFQAEEQKQAKVQQERRLKMEEELKKQKISKQPPSPRSVASKKSKRILKHQDASEDEVRKFPSKAKIVDEEKYKRKIQDLQEMLVEKQRKIERLQQQIRSLNLQLQRKGQLIEKNQMLESKHIQQERQYSYQPNVIATFPSVSPTPFGAESFMRQSITNLEDRVSTQKEKYSQLKIKYDQKCKQNEDLVYQTRKLKLNIAELEQKDKRRNIPRSIQEMQSEIEDSNRKILQLSRSINQAKLQRDSFEDEVRIVRKKLAQVSKQSQQSQSRAMQNEREVEDLKRKQQKAKRQVEQYQQDIKRLKQINRKNLQQLSQVRKSQSQFIIQRKKVLDEVVRLQGVIAQKETDMLKINKQMEKLKGKINETTEGRQGRERQYRGEMEKLEIQRSKGERKNRELEETVRVLREKIDVLEREAKKVNEERKQTYGQKLKNYINQIASIKQLVEQYQQEITQLKLQNSQFFQQNQLLKTSFEKLEIKYEEQLQKSTHLEAELNALQTKLVQCQDQLKAKVAQEEKSKIVISSLRKDLDNQRLLGRKKTEKLQQLEEMNQRFVYDIKQLKIRLNQYETNSDDRQKMAEELFASQRTIGSLEEELNKISEEYHYHTEKYVYTLEDVEKAIKQIKELEDRAKEQEFAKLMQQLDQNNNINRQKMQKQLLTLYNQNQKLRVNLHKSNENYLQLQLQLSELQSLRQRCKRLDTDKSSCDRQLLELSDELKSSKEQIRRLQIKFNESIRNQQNKSTENVILLQKYQDLNKRYQDLNQSYLQLKQDDKTLLDRYKSSIDDKDQTIQKLTGEIQTLNNKLLAFELEINRLKEIQAMNSQDYFKNKKRLQTKIEEISESFRQKERDSESQFKIQLRQLKTKTVKYEQELQEKLRRIEQLEEGVFLLQGEVEELTSQLTDARAQLSEENQLYTLQINKLRTKMKEDQDAYNQQLQNLEEELSAMSKELTTLKYARQNVNGSRLRASRQSENVDERGNKRYEEKIKLKDRRIQELKETILVYQQKLSQNNRKQAFSDQIQHYKTKLSQTQQQYQQLLEKKQAQIKLLTQNHKELGQQYHKLKIKQQELILIIEQKDMEISSLRSQTAMINKLYTDLQREIDVRKENIGKELQMGEKYEGQLDSVRKECNKKDQEIDHLKSKLNENQALLKKKGHQLRNMTEMVTSLQAQKESAADQQRNKLEYDYLSKIKQLQSQNQRLLQQQKKLRNDLSLQTKQLTIYKSQLAEKEMTLQNLLRQVQNNDKIIGQNQDLLSKYVALNRQSLAKTGQNIDQLVDVVVQLRDIERSKQEQLIKVTQQLQELKFIEENRFLEHEELKRQNYQLRRSDEERQLCLLRIQQLEESLLRLQDQKQMLMFQLEAVKVQLANVQSKIADGGGVDWRNIKQKIRDLLEQRYI